MVMSSIPSTDHCEAADRRTGIRRLASRGARFALLLVCAPAFAAAKPKPPALTLVYDHAPAACHYLLNLYNRDIRERGYVDTRAHRVFTAIHWTLLPNHPAVRMVSEPGNDIAFFDVNNAGRALPVVRLRVYMGGLGVDTLTVLQGRPPISVQQFLAWSQSRDRWKYIRATFPPTTGPYPLKHAPARFTSTRTQPPSRPLLPPVGLALHPLRYRGTVYLSASFNAEPGRIGIGREFGRWIVIGKYRPNDTFEDVCYFRHGAFRTPHPPVLDRTH